MLCLRTLPALRGLLVALTLDLAALVGEGSDDDADRDDGDQDGAGGIDLRRDAEANLAVDLLVQQRLCGALVGRRIFASTPTARSTKPTPASAWPGSIRP